MNYAQIRKMDISNGLGIGVSLFVSGCDLNPHCPGCFNSEIWDFDAGKPFTDEVKKKFLDLADKPYVDRITILGGDPLSQRNFEDVDGLVNSIRTRFGKSKKIWIYTGYTFDEVYEDKRVIVLPLIDVLVDGRFIEAKKDLSLPFMGSNNQRIIDVPKTLGTGEIALLKF